MNQRRAWLERRTRIEGLRQAGVAILVLLGLSCVAIDVPVEITPETLPPEIEGARWQDTPVRYCVSPVDGGFASPVDLAASVEDVFRRWGIATVNDGACDGDPISGNGRNEIGWGEPPDQGDGLHAAGYTRLLFQSCAGGCGGGSETQVVEADVFVHPDPPGPLRSDRCLAATLLHETGHFLGLPHLESPAVMAPVSRDCPRELTEADREAIRALYS